MLEEGRDMKEIAMALKKETAAGRNAMLVTIVGDKGSAPRGAGAMMVVGEADRLAGTIGRGMLEFRVTELAQKKIGEQAGHFEQYRLTKDEVAGLGMVCGGDVDVLFTYVAAEAENMNVIQDVTFHLAKHLQGWLLLPFDGAHMGFLGRDGFTGMEPPVMKSEICAVENNGVLDTKSGKVYVQKLKNTSRVFVFGGGHLAQELVPLLTHLGFRCIVTDDREEYSTRELFPDAEELHTLDYKELEGQFDVQPQDFIVTVTRGHMGDFEVEEFALGTPAHYIGVVGSRKKTASVNERLRADGFSDSDIARVTTPIGIDIKSETPAEIAVSIAAQLIKARAEYRE